MGKEIGQSGDTWGRRYVRGVTHGEGDMSVVTHGEGDMSEW